MNRIKEHTASRMRQLVSTRNSRYARIQGGKHCGRKQNGETSEKSRISHYRPTKSCISRATVYNSPSFLFHRNRILQQSIRQDLCMPSKTEFGCWSHYLGPTQPPCPACFDCLPNPPVCRRNSDIQVVSGGQPCRSATEERDSSPVAP